MTPDHYLSIGLAIAGLVAQGLTAYISARIANAYYQGKSEERFRSHEKRLDTAEPKIDKLQTQVAYMRGERG